MSRELLVILAAVGIAGTSVAAARPRLHRTRRGATGAGPDADDPQLHAGDPYPLALSEQVRLYPCESRAVTPWRTSTSRPRGAPTGLPPAA